MFTQAAPSPATLATSTSSASPASPPRTGRLRGLSYLRSYTHNHLLSRESNHAGNAQTRPPNTARATTFPTQQELSPPLAAQEPAPSQPSRKNPPRMYRSTSDIANSTSSGQEFSQSTSGWLPTVGGHSGIAPVATQTQSTTTVSSSAVLSANSSSVPLNSNLAAMARTRNSTNTGASASLPTENGVDMIRPSSQVQGERREQLPSIRFSSHQEDRSSRPSLVFTAMSRTLPTGNEVIRVGRYSERDGQPNPAPNVPSAAAVGFKSKVVSRRHCEFWFQNGKWYIKDVKSSSGTFLNHIRLSSPGTESKPYIVSDGDIVQLGIDFKGGEEMIFRCVKIRIELNRGWQSGLNKFNVKAHKRLREMSKNNLASAGGSSSQDCSICLGAIAPCQSLFVAPCSHTWHYKCIRVILTGPQWPHFLCPNCRAVADLDAEVDDPYDDGGWEEIDYEENDEGDVPVRAASSRLPTESTDEDSDDVQNSADAVAQLSVISSDSSQEAAVREDSEPWHSSVCPMPIRRPVSDSNQPSANAETSSSSEPSHARTPSPTGCLPAPEFLGVDGPLTPRNDVGPFVLDGSAGMRIAQTRMHSGLATENTPPIREV